MTYDYGGFWDESSNFYKFIYFTIFIKILKYLLSWFKFTII